jgi:hypothetical protein
MYANFFLKKYNTVIENRKDNAKKCDYFLI